MSDKDGKISYLLIDIEGTTTPIEFVHNVLFPYSSRNLRAYVEKNATDPNVQAVLSSVRRTVLQEESKDIGAELAVSYLLEWIKADRKHPALKTLQGYLWKQGYDAKELVSQIYDDVFPNLKKWRSNGINLGVYSSGSIAAQKLIFGHTTAGDLTTLFSDYFDTSSGHKRETIAYQRIAKAIVVEPSQIGFLSDAQEELDAARSAGLRTVQLVRAGTKTNTTGHDSAKDFYEVDKILKLT